AAWARRRSSSSSGSSPARRARTSSSCSTSRPRSRRAGDPRRPTASRRRASTSSAASPTASAGTRRARRGRSSSTARAARTRSRRGSSPRCGVRCEAPEGHAGAMESLLRAARERRLAHALLFAGPEGIGKFLAAEWLAFGLVCERGAARACGACGPCKRLRAGAHPDVFAIDPDLEGEEEIRIGRITYRERDPRANGLEFLSLRPMEGGWRVVIVRDAERMTDEAQNALLKTLEEPGDSTLLVLVAAREEILLDTTRSRCVRVGLRPLEVPAVARLLGARGIAADEAA